MCILEVQDHARLAYLGSHVGERHSAERAGEGLAEIHDPHAVEGSWIWAST